MDLPYHHGSQHHRGGHSRIPDRHCPDISVRRRIELAAVLWAGAIDVYDNSGPGANPRGSDYWSARATGTSLLGGLIIPEDIASGSIDHALAFANIAPRNTNGADPTEPFDSDSFWPASTTETDYYSTNPQALASGQRIRLKQNIVGSDGLPLDEENDLKPITRMYLQALLEW